MKRASLNKCITLTFLMAVLGLGIPTAQAALPCGYSICWEQPEITHSSALGDSLSGLTNIYFTGVNVAAEVSYEDEDVYEIYNGINKEPYYSLDAGVTWSPAWSQSSRTHLVTDNADIWENVTDMVVLNSGHYVFVWNPYTGPTSHNAYFKILDADGVTIVNETRIDPNTILDNQDVSVSVLSDGGFVATWHRISADRSDVYFQIFDSGGVRIGGAVLVTENVGGVFYHSSKVTDKSDGGFVVTAQRTFDSSNESHIVMRSYSASGIPDNSLVPVGSDSLPYKSEQQSVEKIQGDRFAIVWRRTTQNANSGEDIILMSIYTNNGVEQQGKVRVDSGVLFSRQENPVVKAISANHFIVTWIRVSPTIGNLNNEGYLQYARYYDVFGIPFSDESIVCNPCANYFADAPVALKPIVSILSDETYLLGFSPESEAASPRVRHVTGGVSGFGPSVKIGASMGKVVGISGGGIAANHQAAASLYLYLSDEKRKIVTPTNPYIQTTQSADLQFKLVHPINGEEWLSPTKSYIYLPENDGDGGTIDYPDGITSDIVVPITFTSPCVSCVSLQVMRQSLGWRGPGDCGAESDWLSRPWVPTGDDSTLKNHLDYTSTDSCSKFRITTTNAYGAVFHAENPKIIGVDASGPQIMIPSSGITIVLNQVEIDFLARDFESGVVAVTYQINDDLPIDYTDPILFTGNTLSLQLANGTHRIRIHAVDYAGNSITQEEIVTVDATLPEIIIHGIEEGGVYGENIEYLLNLTQPLTDVVTLVDGMPRNDLVGLADGVHTLTIQGRDALNNLITKTVTFTIDRNSFTLSLLSPQQKTYESNAIRIQYSSSQPLNNVWYTLNGGPQQQDLNLSNLADGTYTLQLFGQMAGGATVSVMQTFTVQAAIPVLQVDEPRQNAVYASNQITVSFFSDSPVAYQLGEQTGIINTGSILSMPQDGDHSLLLTATHPVGGHVVSQRINFKTDSVVPSIDLQSPAASYYPFTEIPIEYTSNKPLSNIQYLLDDVEVTGSVLTQLSSGTHSFQIVAQDSSGQSISSERVQFAVSHLAIVRPQEGEEILSEALPPVLPFEFAAEGTFNNFTYALDNGTPLLITDPPGTEISIPVSPGSHEILLRGTFNEFQTVRKARFSIGAKNIALGADSIDYDYSNCNAGQTECDVDITIKVSNVGDYDISDMIEVRFDHIGAAGYYTENRVIAGLAIDASAELLLPTMRARLGDTFSLTLDPYAKISGEWPNDNQHQLPFQSAQITDIRLKLPADNAYFQDVSAFEMVKVDTAGPVAMIEYRLGDWTFVDDTAADGFESIVDLGLLNQSNSCMHIVAYGGNGVALDSQSQCFTIKRLRLEQLAPMKIDWAPHASAANRVNINLIDRQQLATDLAQERSLSMLRSASIIPDVQENGRITYTLISNPAGAQGRQVSQPAGLANTPIIGGSVPMPNGHGLFFTVIDPNTDMCRATSALPILTQPHGDKIAEFFQDELADINAMGELNLSPLEEFARVWLASIGIPYYYRESAEINIELGDYTIPTYFNGFSYLGWFQIDIPAQLASIDVGGEFIYGFDAKGCRVRDEQDGSVSVVVNAKYELGIKDGSFDLSTGRFGLTTIGRVQLEILKKIPILPVAYVYGNVKVYPQHFQLPLEIGTTVDMSIVDEQLSFGPAQSHFHMSINHNTRLAKADIQAYPIFGFGFGGGYDFKANLSLNGVAKADWVGGSNDDTGIAYAVFDGSLVIKRRKKVCFMGACYKKSWKHFDTPYSEHVEEGIAYTDVQVAAAVDAVEPFWTADINDLYELALYSIITGGTQQTSQELLACGLFQDLTANMSHSPLYELNGGSCQAIQSPDIGTYAQVFTDPACTAGVSYAPMSFLEYCRNNLLPPQSKYFVGNANAWPHSGAPRYDSIGKNSRWTLSHSTRLDAIAVSQEGNRRPFLKKVEYRNSFEPINGVPQHEGCSLEMRIYKQDILAENLKPLLYIHGGAWKYRGFGATGMEASISHYTERGFVVFAPYHRLMGSSDGPVECQGATGRQITSDAEAALEWVKLHGPALGASNAKITLVGQSAGAHLSTWLAVHNTYGADILKSLLFYPPIDFEYFVQQTAPGGVFESPNSFGDSIFEDTRILVGEFLADMGEDPDFSLIDRDNLSPFARENGMPRRIAEGAAFAPTFIIHGNGDELVPVDVSMRLCDAAAGVPFGTTSKDAGNYACGTDSHLRIIEGANHMLDLKCFAADIIDPSVLNVLTGHVPGFDVTMSCPSGLVGAAPAREAIESALQWIN